MNGLRFRDDGHTHDYCPNHNTFPSCAGQVSASWRRRIPVLHKCSPRFQRLVTVRNMTASSVVSKGLITHQIGPYNIFSMSHRKRNTPAFNKHGYSLRCFSVAISSSLQMLLNHSDSSLGSVSKSSSSSMTSFTMHTSRSLLSQNSQ